MTYQIEFSPDAIDHLGMLRKFEQQRITNSVHVQLKNEPLRESRHRKLMRSNLLATRELRIGDFRVYYDVDEEKSVVLVRAIGTKKRNCVSIAGEEVDLS
jgi:mRNA-degrading endonuclease RelE of RelBE toxin-antitoxin system